MARLLLSSSSSLIRILCFLLIFMTLQLLARGPRRLTCSGLPYPSNPSQGPGCRRL
ncbi:hypothetical protein BT93_J2044 [Corymbia citriodora subsp. variegata]|nr:hypothetical protein BT93_J2044 [Corymbia citriodora subsp. variegata]